MAHAEDFDLWLRIADRFQLANLEAVLLKYRVHPNQVSVRWWKQQALSNLAARLSALARRTGDPDPFDSATEITAKVLARAGVSEAKQQTAVVRACLSYISSMCEAGEYSVARSGMTEMLRSSDLKLVARPEIADLHLLAARLYWHERRYARSMVSASRALIARPIILGRPLKPLMRRLRRADAPGANLPEI